jgi:hypothetical protein
MMSKRTEHSADNEGVGVTAEKKTMGRNKAKKLWKKEKALAMSQLESGSLNEGEQLRLARRRAKRKELKKRKKETAKREKSNSKGESMLLTL